MNGYHSRFETHSPTRGLLRVGPLTRFTAERFGAALRHKLLRQVPGAAVGAVRIDGTDHEFSLLDDVVEDAVQIVENLKQIRLRLEGMHALVTLQATGPAHLTAADLAADSRLAVADPARPIATVAAGGKLSLTLEIAAGTGYRSASEADGSRPGWIEIDRRFSPVERVALDIEEGADGAFLLLTIATDGTLAPASSTAQAAVLLADDHGDPALCRTVEEAALAPIDAPRQTTAPPARHTREFCATPPLLDPPDLLELPRESFRRFLQPDSPADGREDRGLEKLLRQAFAAQDPTLTYTGYSLDEPEFSFADCLRLGRTHATRLVLHLRSGGATFRVVVGPLPLMGERGTFAIAGVEKVVVGRLQATPDEAPNDLAVRPLQLVGEQLAIALEKPLRQDLEAVRELSDVGALSLPRFAAAIARFFTENSLVRPLESTNPLTAVSQLRAVVQQGYRRTTFRTRDSHSSHFGRLCLLETPEGEKIGINQSAALFARTDDRGRLLTPYQSAEGKIDYLSAAEERERAIADLGAGDAYKKRYGGQILARKSGTILRIPEEEAEYRQVHPAQALGASAGLIPMMGHDDANRALMGTNMQKQAVPLLSTEAPLVRTGLEEAVAAAASPELKAQAAGTVLRVAADQVVVRQEDGRERAYPLTGFAPSSLDTCLRQRPAVAEGESVSEGQLLAEGPAVAEGQLALGRNLLVGFLCWEGANFEDAIVVSERVLRDGLFTSIGVRRFTLAIPAKNADTLAIGAGHLPDSETTHLDAAGIAAPGTLLCGGQILVACSARVDGETHDRSLRLPAGQSGTVTAVERLSAGGDPLAEKLAGKVVVTLALRRPLRVGDKLANRHGAKGIVGLVLPEDRMPFLPDGRPLDILLNPLGVPSRMNLGQLLETHLGLAARQLNCTVVTPAFNGATLRDVDALLAEAGLPVSGMLRLRDGRTGRLFDRETTVGYQYYMKLSHLADDKLQARGSGDRVPLDDRVRTGGLHLGVMETWALQAHGASRILQEMTTLQADDDASRQRTADALLAGGQPASPTVPESVRRLLLQLRALCLDLRFLDGKGQPLDLFAAGTSIDAAASLTLSFADAATVRGWSAGPLDPESFDPRAVGELRHLELPHPVAHPWGDLCDGAVPAIEALPVLPHALSLGARLDPLYRAVCAAIPDDGALQPAIDHLMGESGLTRLLYGKRGWFATAMSGRIVDYSARAVVAPGFDLRYDQCGLPRSLAKTLFEPFVLARLLRTGRAASEEQGRQLLREGDPAADAILEQVAAEKLVLLHRAPVLHRWGIQAFKPRLTDERVIRVHPLTLISFNADFDGDELDLFLPLSEAAQEEARAMLPSANQLSLTAGACANPLAQDMVYGCYYATLRVGEKERRCFATPDELAAAFERDEIGVHDPVALSECETSAGRALFDRLLPASFPPVDRPADKRYLSGLLLRCRRELGTAAAARLADALMRFGFRHATRSGLSIGKQMLPQYSRYDEELADAWKKADELAARETGEGDADPVVEHWVEVNDRFKNESIAELAAHCDGLNPVYHMAHSGARANENQIRQHISMRGLFADPDGRILEAPCTTSFMRGLSPFEYLASTFGARKGLIDTCLKSANAGFLFKRIVNAVQDLLVAEEDCGTREGIAKRAAGRIPLVERIQNRTALEDLTLPGEEGPLVKAGELITPEAAQQLADSGLESVAVRSPLTCRSTGGTCARCYGTDLGSGRAANLGLPVGIIAAQSLGEPMTQLTFRTFYLGALSRRDPARKSNILGGLPRLDELFEAGRRPGQEESPERRKLEQMLQSAGPLAVAEYLLDEIADTYRLQGVIIDDRHLELVVGHMLASGRDTAEPGLLGVSEAARREDDFIAAALAYDGIPALARAAAAGQRVPLNGVRACTLFGKAIPARRIP